MTGFFRPASIVALAAWAGHAAARAQEVAEEPVPPAATVSRAPDGSILMENATVDDALRLAQGWIEQGQAPLAEQLLAQIAPIWPDDARIPFLRGLAARAVGDERGAVRHFRDTLEIDPNANRARYELARSYEALGDWDQAAFQLRFVLGSDAPELVKRDVAGRLMAMSDMRRWTTSFELALAPSTNINVAPSEAVIDPIFGSDNPAVLTGDSMAQSGLGAHVAGGIARQFLLGRDTPTRRLRGQIGAAGALTDYEQARFDDATASAFVGASMRRGAGEIGGDIRALSRWYGGEIYEDATIARLFVGRRITSPVYLLLTASVAERDNRTREDLDGYQTSGDGELRWSVSGSSFLSLDVNVTRFDTSASSTSYWDSGLTLSAYKDFRRGWSAEIAPGYAFREHDGPDPFFAKTREDDRWSLAGSLIKRDLQVMGFAPFVRYRYTRNESSLELFDYDQHAAELGLTGVF